MTLSFSVNWDYRCPFARNAHEHLVTGLRAGADWDVTFVAFSLDQAHVAEGEAPVFDRPADFPALFVNQAGIVVRDRYPDRFFDAHLALFAARHDRGLDVRDREVVTGVLGELGLPVAEITAAIDEGWPLEVYRKEHTGWVEEHRAFGVPTFVRDGQAVFVRLMHRPAGNGPLAVSTVERVVDLVAGWPELNELKHTTIPR
ncbi:MAG TPA: hypothetical protein VKV36_07450 [Acidimicrobiales bacterium]|nr:hypothetical protein [Acidimicrobiales bacterium]